MKTPTARQIDAACRAGFFVYYGDLEKGTARPIAGAVDYREGEVTIRGRVWVNMEDDYSWHYVEASEVTITTETTGKETDMALRGKREGGRPSHLKIAGTKSGKKSGSKQSAAEAADQVKAEQAKKLLASGKVEEVNEERSGQLRIPGAPKKVHSAIEAQALLVHELQMKRIKAGKKEGEARDVLTKMMVEAKIEEQDLPDDLIAEIDREPKALVHKKRKKGKSKKERADEDSDE